VVIAGDDNAQRRSRSASGGGVRGRKGDGGAREVGRRGRVRKTTARPPVCRRADPDGGERRGRRREGRDDGTGRKEERRCDDGTGEQRRGQSHIFLRGHGEGKRRRGRVVSFRRSAIYDILRFFGPSSALCIIVVVRCRVVKNIGMVYIIAVRVCPGPSGYLFPDIVNRARYKHSVDIWSDGSMVR